MAVGLLVLLSGCSTGAGAKDDRKVRRESAVISESVRWLLAQSFGASPRSLPITVFVESVGEREIALEVQTEVVQRLSGEFKVRFIDEIDEGIDKSSPSWTVRDKGMIVRLGSVPGEDVDETNIPLYAERYIDQTRTVAYKLIMSGTGEQWSVAPYPEIVKARSQA